MDRNTKALLDQAVQWHRQDNLGRAGNMYRRILSNYPNHSATLNLLGLVEYQKGNFESAFRFISLALQNEGKISEYHNNLGTVLMAMGQMDDARKSYLRALALCPDCADTAYNLGGLYLVEEDFENAVTYYERAITKRNNFFPAYTNLAAIYNQRKEYQRALATARKGLEYRTDDFSLLTNLGRALKGLGKWEEGIAVLKKAIASNPENFEGYLNLGNMLQDLDQSEEALICYQKASLLNPENAKIYNDLATLLNSMGNAKDALQCCQHAIRLYPSDPFPYHNMGTIYLKLAEREKAIRCFNKAISLSPDLVEAQTSLGIALQEEGRNSEAVDCFYKAIALNSAQSKIYCHLVRALQHECRWEELERYGAILDAHTQDALKMGLVPDEVPFLNLSRHCDPKLNYRVAKARSDNLVKRIITERKSIRNLTDRRRVTSNKKITIGYLSNNFRNHPTSHLIMGLFKYHDRDFFNIHCYSYGKNDDSHYRRQIEKDCDHFVDLLLVDHMAAAKKIYNDKVDILVDLVGQMRATRMEIPALRPSPVQVRWLGMAGTSGADFYDYIITDRIVTPENQAECYSETFAYMPYTYQINNDTQHVFGKTFQRKELGLPEESFIYACFCSTYKIDSVIYDAWMRILEGVPGSVLWLLEPSNDAKKQLRSEASIRGIDPERILFAPKMDRPKHLARISQADLCLDTRIVSGAATTSEILWSGIPVLTLKGRHFASRMAASILSAMELPELIANNLDAYEKRAIKFANDYDFLKTITNRVKIKKSSTPLFDTAGFVKNLEKLFTQMQQFQVRGDQKRIISV